MKSNPNPTILSLQPFLLSETDFESCDKALTLQFPFHQHAGQYRISGNCNGLLCVNHISDHKQVYIWNPIINHHITIYCLPAPSIRFPGYPNCTEFRFGFGFDEESNVYKVVRGFTETDFVAVSGKYDMWTQISVYTIGVDSMWRTVKVDIPGYLCTTNRITPLVNGVLHWTIASTGSLLTFDLKREVIGELLPPPCDMEYNEIVELGGLLCVVDKEDESEMHIWVMKEYGQVSSWSKQYIIGIPQGGFDNMFPLGFTDNGEIIVDMTWGMIALYSPEANTFRHHEGFTEAVFLTFAYTGSIISPTVISKAGQNLLEEEIGRS